MTTTYTKIAKPVNTSYTVISGGKTLFDDSVTTFDSSGMPFDGIDLVYTKISKANGTLYTKIPKAT